MRCRATHVTRPLVASIDFVLVMPTLSRRKCPRRAGMSLTAIVKSRFLRCPNLETTTVRLAIRLILDKPCLLACLVCTQRHLAAISSHLSWILFHSGCTILYLYLRPPVAKHHTDMCHEAVPASKRAAHNLFLDEILQRTSRSHSFPMSSERRRLATVSAQ